MSNYRSSGIPPTLQALRRAQSGLLVKGEVCGQEQGNHPCSGVHRTGDDRNKTLGSSLQGNTFCDT